MVEGRVGGSGVVTGDVTVVAAAIVREGRVLCARRRSGPHAGQYEFPGGKVEPGESEVAALVRECREELGVTVVVGERCGPDIAIDVGVLRLYAASTPAEPTALEHDDLRWCGAGDLDALPWIPADRPLLAALGPLVSC